MHSCTVSEEKLCDGSPAFSTKKTLREHGRDHKLKEAETRNLKREAQKSSICKI